MMIRFFLLSLVLWSCAEDKQSLAPEQSVSIIISSDSVIIYGGKLKKNIPYQKIAIDEIRIKAILSKEKANTAEELTVLLKLSSEPMGGGLMAQIANVIRWAKQSGINNVVLADTDAKDLAVFKLKPVPWAYLDSLFSPHPFNLKMPKDEDEELTIEKVDQHAPATLSVVLNGVDDWYCYEGADSASGRSYSRKEFSALLGKKKKQWGEKLVVLVRFGFGAGTESIIAPLEEKAKSKIKNYIIVYPSPGQAIRKRNLTAEDFLLRSHPPVDIEPPNTVRADQLPEDNAFLIEIKEDNSVWYQPRSLVSRMVSQEVRKPVSARLQKIVADYKASHSGIKIAYLIKGHPKSTYPVFQQVIDALKANNINNFNLVTSEE